MLTFEQLAELGAQIVAGRVVYKGKFVDGILVNGTFDPAPGSALFVSADAAYEAEVAKEEKKPRKTRAPKVVAETDDFGLDIDSLEFDKLI